MNKQNLLTLAITGLALAAGAAAKPPNILFIMSDDHDANTIGCYDSWIKDFCPTPRLDQLAKEGALFKNCFAINSLCAPSRSTILTGQYSHEHGVYTLREKCDTATKSPSLAKTLQAGGYQTAVFGKWHIEGDNLGGFDDYAVTLGQGSYYNPAFQTPGGKAKQEGYTVDIATDMSIDFIKKSDKSRPFFVMCHFKAAHGPWQYAERHKDLFKDVTLPEPPTLFDDYKNRFPEGIGKTQARIHDPDNESMSQSFWQQKGKKGRGGNPNGNKDYSGLDDIATTKATYQDFAKDYLRCIAAVDENVGKMIDYLKQTGELDNTVIIYTGDQGFYIGEHGFFDKRLGLDEAMRMPLLMRYPKEIKPGTVVEEIVNNVDFAASMISYGELPVPEDMSGYSFRKLLQGDKASWKRDATIYYFYSNGCPKHYGVRTKDYKLLHYVGKKRGDVIGSDLFDLRKDPNEMVSVLDDPEYSEVLQLMEQKLADEMKAIKLSPERLPGGEDVVSGREEGEGKKKKSGKKDKKKK